MADAPGQFTKSFLDFYIFLIKNGGCAGVVLQDSGSVLILCSDKVYRSGPAAGLCGPRRPRQL